MNNRSTGSVVLKADGYYPAIKLDKLPLGDRPLVASELLGRAHVPNQPFVQADGTLYRLDTDYIGNKRNTDRPAPGPFSAQPTKTNPIRVWPIGRK